MTAASFFFKGMMEKQLTGWEANNSEKLDLICRGREWGKVKTQSFLLFGMRWFCLSSKLGGKKESKDVYKPK